MMDFLDRWIHYQDPSLPRFSSLAYLYVAILASSLLIAIDFGKRKRKRIAMAQNPEFSSIAMIGCGSLGGGMALRFAEVGVGVGLSDPSEEFMDGVVRRAEENGHRGRVTKYRDYRSLCDSLPKPRLIVFALPRGYIADQVLEDMMPCLSRNDIILDCGNEHYANTERRQHMTHAAGIRYIGCGVSGRYQSERAGPSLCPGGDESALKAIMPLLEKVAAKDKQGRPCVGIVGKGGAGHYVKMAHNGIEHGMMSALCEVWGIMRKMGLGHESIGDIFTRWNGNGELKGTFLVSTTAALSHKRDTKRPYKNELAVSQVLDQVVQDITGEEGLGICSNTDALERHIPAFTLNIAHGFRLASGYRGARQRVVKISRGVFTPQPILFNSEQERDLFIEYLRKATYAACLASYIQGLSAIAKADRQHGWNVDYDNLWKIWRAGCIIQADYISDFVLAPVLLSSPRPEHVNLLLSVSAMDEIRKVCLSLRQVVLKALQTDQITPALSAALEYFKAITGKDLPTRVCAAEMDYFGLNEFEKNSGEGGEEPAGWKRYFGWKSVRRLVKVQWIGL